MSLNYEQRYFDKKIRFVVGCDEAGRGPLAGPVVASAVILPYGYQNDLINDSKQMTDKTRRQAFIEIQENAIAIGVGIVSPEEIDKINIYQASRLAMEIALRAIKHPYSVILTDCMPLVGHDVPVDAIVHGDAKAQCIAAASIIAKVTRDDIMIALDKQYPVYGFAKHKGYPTKQHIAALTIHGPIPGLYRYTYGPVRLVVNQDLLLFK